MRCKVMIYTAVLTTLLLAGKMAAAQQIYYSPFIPDSFDVAAKAGDLYWVESKAGYRPGGRRATSRSRPGAQTFDLYDSKLRWQALVSTGPLTPDVFKEYYLGSDAYFDQVYLRADAAGTSVTLNRYSAQGLPLAGNKKIADLPVWERASSFLLARSQDRTKILLLAFEAVPEDGLRLHALLFDADWQVLSYKSYHHANIAQPLIQDDFSGQPLESFGSGPLKVCNSGDWLMASPARTSTRFLLQYVRAADAGVLEQDMILPEWSTREDVALSLDDQARDVSLAVLSRIGFSALKQVTVLRYALDKHQAVFDSVYRFSTLLAAQSKTPNLVHEQFLAVPGRGFMLLKEFGRPYPDSYASNPYDGLVEGTAIYLLDSVRHPALAPVIHASGYTRLSQLGGTRLRYDRGDLNLFYFPARPGDSTWTGRKIK